MNPDEVRRIAHVIEPERTLDAGQLDGATAIAGTSRSVAISGAAGTGKTTMLKVAGAALRRQGRNLIIVAPTKKASAVAGRETQSDSSSLHQLLHDYGWRWTTGDSGATSWTRLSPGDIDPATAKTYAGPRIRIRPGDRIVVDEAGMLDLEAARGLVDVLERTGAGAALVGDERQALPVGHSGAMALFWRSAADQVELSTIHRYKDPSWADLSLRLREPRNQEAAAAVADELLKNGHVVLTSNDAAAQQAMVDGWIDASRSGQTIALVTATHAEAQAVSEMIQARRMQNGTVSTDGCVLGQAGQAIFIGDVVQTRQNDGRADVQNRQSWIVKKITSEWVVLVSAFDSSDLRNISHDYANSHLHLGYATTVYGVQGETTDLSLVGPGVDAAGLYVGLTRGKQSNSVILVAPTEVSAKSQLMEMMQRGSIEETLQASRGAAQVEFNRAAQARFGPRAPVSREGVGPAASP
ncbi:ATP-dependent DNA helicase [Leifsonia sp. L25]|uniref:ATP-dependent DNA helicase n=1 Tax=Actinomycetes TaxID=1760 RepID=UPI003D68C3BF